MNKLIFIFMIVLLSYNPIFAGVFEKTNIPTKTYFRCQPNSKYGKKANEIFDLLNKELISSNWFMNFDYTWGKIPFDNKEKYHCILSFSKLGNNKLIWKDLICSFIPIYNKTKKRYDQILFRLDHYDGKEIKKGGRTHYEDLYDENGNPKDDEYIKNNLIRS